MSLKIPSYYRNEFEGFLGRFYDPLANIISFGQIERLRKRAVKSLDLSKRQSVIDFACGTGGLTKILASEVGVKGRVVGVDLSQKMLSQAEKKSKSFPQIEYLRNNFEKLPYPNEEFNAATVGLALHEVPLKARVNLYQEAYRLLKPGGKFLVFDYTLPDNGFFRILFGRLIKIIEAPTAWEYLLEEHQKILKEEGFNLVKKEKRMGVVEIAVYQKT